jgi:hypothetical protein
MASVFSFARDAIPHFRSLFWSIPGTRSAPFVPPHFQIKIINMSYVAYANTQQTDNQHSFSLKITKNIKHLFLFSGVWVGSSKRPFF